MWQPKNILVATEYGDWIFSIAKPCGYQNFQSTQKRNVSHVFGKLSTNWRLSKNIWQGPLFEWLKKSDCHLIMAICRMVTKFFGLPSDKPPPSSGDWNILVAIQWCGCVGWRSKFFDYHLMVGVCRMVTKCFWSLKKGACHMFLGTFWQMFLKKKPQTNLLCWLNFFCYHDYRRGVDQIFSITIQHTPIIRWWLKFLDHPKGYVGDDFFIKKWYYMCRYIYKIRSWGCTFSRDSNDYLFWRIMHIY